MDFCLNVPEKNFYEDEILSMGGRIYRIPSKSENLKEYKRQLHRVVTENGYDHVLRITSNAAGFLDLMIARKAGARVCAARSSNASDGGGMKSLIAHRLGRLLYSPYVDVKIAPSDLAAIYTFGKGAYEKGQVNILHNAVDLDVFRFDPQAREAIRREFGLADSIKLIGHVGRFAPQKNHRFLVEVLAEVCKLEPDARLMLVGTGPLEAEIKGKLATQGLLEKVIFTGVRPDVPKLLSAMDVFLFPSFYEGMPNTVIEAQATGLPCVIANTITQEADITGLVEYCSLSMSAQEWANRVTKRLGEARYSRTEQFAAQKYDIASVTAEFVKLTMGE